MADEVANHILAHGHSRLAHPGTNQIISPRHRRRAKRARQPARLVADPRQLLNPPHDRFCVGSIHLGFAPV